MYSGEFKEWQPESGTMEEWRAIGHSLEITASAALRAPENG
jgi:hypothetical protein